MARVPSEGPEQLFHFAPAAGAEVLRMRRGAEPGEKLLITGIAGGLGRLIAKRLGDYFKVAGVDRSPWEGFPPNVSMHVVDLRKRKFEDVFRTERPDALVHHAFVRHFRSDPRVRHEVNVLGTKRVLEYAIAYGVKRVVVLSSSYVYGALPDNPYDPALKPGQRLARWARRCGGFAVRWMVGSAIRITGGGRFSTAVDSVLATAVMEASRPARFPSCARSATTSNGPATSCHRAQAMT